MHNVDIVETRLYGTYARNVGQLVPRLKKLVLREFNIYSFLFDSFTQLSFHPRLIMSSAHVVVRSLSILRECLSDKIRSQTPLTVQYLYFYRAVRLDIELDRLDDIERELGLDLADPLGSFVAVGTYLEQFVSRYSTGTHGATGVNGPGEPASSLLSALCSLTDEPLRRSVPEHCGRRKRARLLGREQAQTTATARCVSFGLLVKEGVFSFIMRRQATTSRTGRTTSSPPNGLSRMATRLRCATSSRPSVLWVLFLQAKARY